MGVALLAVACVALAIAVVVLVMTRGRDSEVAGRLDALDRSVERVDRQVQDEFRNSRRESAEAIQRAADSLVQSQSALGQAQASQLETFATHLSSSSQSSSEQISQLRADTTRSLQSNAETTTKSIGELSRLSLERVDALATALTDRTAALENRVEQALQANADGMTKSIGELSRLSLERVDALAASVGERVTALESRSAAELSAVRRESQTAADALRQAVAAALTDSSSTQNQRLSDFAALQEQQWTGFRAQVDTLRSTVETKVESLRTTVEQRLHDIQQDNATKLDQMRQTVDEKLQTTLEARLGESFRHVSERLEQVYKGLGEMQVLATGVGDLKRVLANVKARGTWGEVQLATLLDQVLAREQYAANVATNETGGERVEFAVRLPGRTGKDDEPMWLPIDSKFPLEDYQVLVDAAERADAPAIDDAARRLEARVKACAKDISTKYLNPPKTTEFAVMFLPNEGLYAEVLRRPGLADFVQREYRIVVAGPTTLWAILSSLQMGFRTLAIERRSSEVWNLLGAVKTEFGKFGTVLDGIQKNLHHAATKIDEARKGTRAIQRKLTDVQELPAPDAAALLDGIVIPADEHDHELEHV